MNFKINIYILVLITLICSVYSTTQTFSGMRLTVQERFVTTLENDTTLYDLVTTISKTPNAISSNYDLKISTYNIDSFDVSSIINSSSYHLLTNPANLYIYTYSQGANTQRCSANAISPNCNITYTTAEEQAPTNKYKYKFEICNNLNYCYSTGNLLSLNIVADTRELVFSGLRLKLKTKTPTTLENDTTLYDLVTTISKTPKVTNSNYDLMRSTYNIDSFDVSSIINSSSYHLLTNPANLYIYTYSQAANTQRCLANAISYNCNITYTTAEEQDPTNKYKYKFEICNNLNYCYSTGNLLNLNIVADTKELIFSGLKLKLKIDFYEPSTITYISPTPVNKIKTTSNTFTIKINDGSFNISSANLSINNQIYEMSNSDFMIWNYTFTNSTLTTPIEYNYFVIYNGGQLEQRTITLYPQKVTNNTIFPSISIISLIITIIITIVFLN